VTHAKTRLLGEQRQSNVRRAIRQPLILNPPVDLGAKEEIQPRISRIARIRKDGFPIRAIREIRGKKSALK